MASRAALEELKALCPWDRDDFRADLALLRESTAVAARSMAADVRLLARLVAQVPRCPGDDRGATPWTSFRREVAVARQVTDRAAATLVRDAITLTTSMPATLALLESGDVTVERATTFVHELDPYDVTLVERVDRELAGRIATLPAWRTAQEVRRAVQLLDPEAGAERVAVKNAARGVLFQADADDQACVTVFGPAVPLTRWHATIEARARALKAAGDPRGLDALRFDLTVTSLPCAVHVPTDATAPTPAHTPAGPSAAGDPAVGGPAAGGPAAGGPAAGGRAAGGPAAGGPAAGGLPTDLLAAGLRPSFVEAAPTDCRPSRPVQAHVVVPVETTLGLSNEPAWLDGYGWVSAPTARLLLVDAELKRVCAQTGSGQLVDVGEGWRRPPPTPEGVRAGLLELVVEDAVLTSVGSRTESQHDPTDRLREFVELRDRFCDGPTGTRSPAGRCHLDHEEPYPTGPTAAWNLTARADRTHGLKHYGWIPLRTPTSTVWTSPAGQLVVVRNAVRPSPGIDADDWRPASLPDADDLHLLDRAQLEAPVDRPPWVPASEKPATTEWTWLTGSDGIAC